MVTEQLLEKILSPTASTKKRKRYATEFYLATDFPPILLDKCIEYALKNRIAADDFMEFLLKISRLARTGMEKLRSGIEIDYLHKANLELIDFYSHDEKFGDKAFSLRLRHLFNEGLFAFEFPSDHHFTFEWETKNTKYFNDKKKPKKSGGYDFRGLLKACHAVVLYHGTSSIFDGPISKTGLLPPEEAGHDIIKKYEKYLTAYYKEEKVRKTIESIKKNRTKSVYFSLARGNIKDDRIYLTNGDVKSYMQRAVEIWGGHERLYRCLVPADRLLADEDSGKDDFIGSFYLSGSAKINGRLEKGIYRVPGDKVPMFTERCLCLVELKKMMDSPYKLWNRFFEINPIDKLLGA